MDDLDGGHLTLDDLLYIGKPSISPSLGEDRPQIPLLGAAAAAAAAAAAGGGDGGGDLGKFDVIEGELDDWGGAETEFGQFYNMCQSFDQRVGALTGDGVEDITKEEKEQGEVPSSSVGIAALDTTMKRKRSKPDVFTADPRSSSGKRALCLANLFDTVWEADIQPGLLT